MRRAALEIRHVIVEDASNIHPSEANGLHQVARNLVLEQNRAGDRARIFYVPAGAQNHPPADVPLEIVHPVGPSLRGRSFLVDQSETSPLFADISAQTVFHIHGVRQPLLVSLTRALRRRGAPYGLTGHSRYAHIFNAEDKGKYWKTAAYVRLLERAFLEKARFLHALTEIEAGELRQMAPRARIAVVPNGVFSSRLDGTPPKPRLRTRDDTYPVFGFFGRLEIAHKGLDLLVDGFARYKKAGGPGTLQIMGTGDDMRRDLVERCQASGVSSHIVILEPQFGKAKNEVLKSWDFFIMPSRFDRMPLSALEAALAGLPLIMTDSTGVDLHRHGAGIRIAQRTSEAVQHALERAATLTPQEWSYCSLSGYHMARSTADWTINAQALRELYLPSRPHADLPADAVLAAE